MHKPPRGAGDPSSGQRQAGHDLLLGHLGLLLLLVPLSFQLTMVGAILGSGKTGGGNPIWRRRRRSDMRGIENCKRYIRLFAASSRGALYYIT